MNKTLVLFAFSLLPLSTFAQPVPTPTQAPDGKSCTSPANHIIFASSGELGYEADGLDLWDLAPNQKPEQAITDFTNKCNLTIPNKIYERMPLTGLKANDFTICTDVYSINIRGVGLSYRCYVDVTVNDPHKYRFTEWKASDQFFDIVNPDTGVVTKTAYEQCKDYTAMLDANVHEMKIFDRHSLLSWVKHRNPVTGKPAYVEMCYVTYLEVAEH